MDPNISYFATRAGWSADALIGIATADRAEHLYVVGKTGMGKSTLLRNLIVQDILSGRGVGVIDPHGSLALELLDCIPPWRMNEVVYFDPSGEREHPIGWNPLRHVPDDERHLVASNIVEVFRAIWKLSPERTPRPPYVLYQVVRALLDLPTSEAATLLCVPRLLSDESYRARVVSFVRDEACRDFWQREVPEKGDKWLSEAFDPVQSRVGAFLESPDLRRVFGQVRRKVEPRALMDEGKIFIANLRKGRLGSETANLIGCFLVTDFETAAYSREEVLERGEKPRPFYLYADEFQNFTTDSFASSLSEVRKYGLRLTLAQQYQNQMSDEVRSAVIGNVGSMVAFCIGEEDSVALAKQFQPYPETTLLELSRYEVCLKLVRAGSKAEPFLAKTLPPLPLPQEYRSREAVIARSRRHYARPREEVEAKLSRWLGGRPRTQAKPVWPRGRSMHSVASALFCPQ